MENKAQIILQLNPEEKAKLLDNLLESLIRVAPSPVEEQKGTFYLNIKIYLYLGEALEIHQENESNENIPSAPKAGNAHESYPLSVKKEAVAIAVKTNNNSEAVRQIKAKYPKYENLNEKSIRLWRDDPDLNDDIEKDSLSRTRKKVRKSTSKYLIAEEELISKIKEGRLHKLKVSRPWIKREAKIIFGDPGFLASDGWFRNFRRRWRVVRRTATHILQKLKDDYLLQVKLYLESLRFKRMEIEKKESKSIIFGNLDQVPLQINI